MVLVLRKATEKHPSAGAILNLSAMTNSLRADTKFECLTLHCQTIPTTLSALTKLFFQDVQEANAGDICALFGVECASGDTFTLEGAKPISMVTRHFHALCSKMGAILVLVCLLSN